MWSEGEDRFHIIVWRKKKHKVLYMLKHVSGMYIYTHTLRIHRKHIRTHTYAYILEHGILLKRK